MEGDDGVGAELGFQGLLNLVGARVGGTEREEPVHADVQLDGATVADAAGAQMMRVADVGEGGDDVEYLALLLLGEGGFHEFVEALLEQSPRHAQDEEGHDDGGQGVEDRPAVAEEDGAADAHEGAEGVKVSIYDVLGRLWATKQEEGDFVRFDAPATGTYLVRIGNLPARKIVVIR